MNEISKYLTTDAVNTNGSSRIGSLNHMKYNDILKRVGPPTIYYNGAHDKVNYEWIFKVNGDIFTIYDYKAWSEVYAFEQLQHWSVGGFANTNKNMQILIDYLVLWTDKAKINRLLTKEYE